MSTLTYTEITVHFKLEDVPTLRSKDSNNNSHIIGYMYIIFPNLKKHAVTFYLHNLPPMSECI